MVDTGAPQLKDWITTAGLIIGPVIAVLITLYMERRREKRQPKLWALSTLLATRYALLADDRIRALNSIDLYYQKDDTVRQAYRAYLDSLTSANFKTENGSAESRRCELELISAMAKALGYHKLTQMDIDRRYVPEFVNNNFTKQQELQAASLEFFKTVVTKLNTPPPAPPPAPPAPPAGRR